MPDPISVSLSGFGQVIEAAALFHPVKQHKGLKQRDWKGMLSLFRDPASGPTEWREFELCRLYWDVCYK